jgi:magnesium-transporting ATPase (P-type)
VATTETAPELGLTTAEARRRLAETGPNALAEPPRPSPLRGLAANFVHLFALLLWIGAALAWIGGEPELSAAIVGVIVLNAVFAFVQEYRAERAISALRLLLPQTARVRRDGSTVEVPAEELVPGDVLVLAAGDRISADAELVSSSALRVDESALTGESYPVEPEREVFAGTYVASGSAQALVTATGMRTRFGRIAELAQRVRRERSPLERELDRVTRFVAVFSVGVGLAFFVVAGLLGMSLTTRFVFAIGVVVSNVPEGLLPTVTLSLAMATQRMARRNALVRRLSSVETLGETTVICTDKTGTLTANQMTAVRLWTPGDELEVEGAGYEPFGRFRRAGQVVDPRPWAELLRAGLLCNDARLVQAEGGWAVAGDPTEGALVVLAEKGGLRAEQEAALAPRLAEIPFDARRRRMTTVHLSEGVRVAYVKGAAEEIVARSSLPEVERRRVLDAARAMEHDALRVLAVARRDLPPDRDLEAAEVEADLELLGLVGMLDPPRPEVAEAVSRCRRAGIRVIMVTGDSGPTAAAIARRIGLAGDGARVVTGPELAAAGDAALRAIFAEGEVVFARIDPEQKLRLARVLRGDGEIVAMTGDGVNDAPALREADIGVAMGKRGTDVAREAADMVLLDDDFGSIVAAVEEGRAVWDNIRRFSAYHFCSNVGELFQFLVWGISAGAIPLPLVVMQVLAIDLGTDSLPALALGVERAERGTMERPPRGRGERLLDVRVMGRVYGYVGLLEGAAGLASFFAALALAGWRPGEPLPDDGAVYVGATAMTTMGIVFAQMGAAMSLRTTRESIFSVGLFSNRLLVAGFGVAVATGAALVYVPGLQDAFHMGPLSAWEWLVLLAWPPVVLLAEELRKAAVRRFSPPPGGSSPQRGSARGPMRSRSPGAMLTP